MQKTRHLEPKEITGLRAAVARALMSLGVVVPSVPSDRDRRRAAREFKRANHTPHQGDKERGKHHAQFPEYLKLAKKRGWPTHD